MAQPERSKPLGLRVVQPELLDDLAPADPRAVRCRRDLRRVNAWMANVRIVARALERARLPEPPARLVELGAGDGTFLLQVARRISVRWPKVEAVAVDRHDLLARETQEGFAGLGWTARAVQADGFEWLNADAGGKVDVLLSNLFLHHFASDLARLLLELVAHRTRFFLACEPERSGLALAGSRLLWLIGCNDVTRHDAVVSVHAGFSGCEVSSLWPAGEGWQLSEGRAGLFSHLFQAGCAGGEGEGYG
jgi:hypothetical protein